MNLKDEFLKSNKLKLMLMSLYPHSARQKFVRRAWEKAAISQNWAESSWAKKIEARKKVKKIIIIQTRHDE